ncbi:MAG: DUF4976 domain-containing protein [Sedimentisphaerales bacterium]|nr:DUF4976 domain-containing protein [Sedimentisphaerales bacterium]
MERRDFLKVLGISLLPLLQQTGRLSRRAIYWHYPHYHSGSIGPCGAVRMGDLKLIEWFDETICGADNRFELYNLKDDIGEQNNLSEKLPLKTMQMKNMLANWRKKVDAQIMTPNPDYDSRKAEKSKL